MIASTLRRVVASRILPLALGLLSVPGLASAQGVSVLTGRVLDSTGAPIPAAGVRVPALDRAAAADSTGRYRLEGLPTGRVTVVGEAPGFAGKRVEVTIPANGTVEESFSLVANARVLAAVTVRARARRQLPLKLAEFEQRMNRGTGRFLGPDDMVKFNGRPLTDALKTVMVGARFQRNSLGELTIISGRSLNPASIRQSTNIKPCGIQIWEDGMLLSDPNASAEFALPQATTGSRTISTVKAGAEREYDVSHLLSNNYMGVEYYADLASTPPGFRTGTPSCGVLVLWTSVPMDQPRPQQPPTQTQSQ